MPTPQAPTGRRSPSSARRASARRRRPVQAPRRPARTSPRPRHGAVGAGRPVAEVVLDARVDPQGVVRSPARSRPVGGRVPALPRAGRRASVEADVQRGLRAHARSRARPGRSRRPDRPRAGACASRAARPAARPAVPARTAGPRARALPRGRRVGHDADEHGRARRASPDASPATTPLGRADSAAGAALDELALRSTPTTPANRRDQDRSMAVPKKKTSKSKSRSRRASAWRLEAPVAQHLPPLRRAPSCPTSCAATAAGTTAARPSTSTDPLPVRVSR